MSLVCTKCGSGSRIEHEGKDLHCKCGNIVVDGVKARWPIVEKKSIEHAGAVTRMPMGRENSQSAKKVNALRDNRSTVSIKLPYDSSPSDVIAQSGSPSPGAQEIEKEVFDTMKKKCRKCNKKNALVDGLCYACYKEEHGHAYVPEKTRGEKKKAIAPVDKGTRVPVDNDLPVYKRTDFTDHLESLIANMEKQLEALRTVLDIVREAA